MCQQDQLFKFCNFLKIFDALNETDGKHMYEDTQNLLQNLAPPNVEVFCLHGSDVPSVEKYALNL